MRPALLLGATLLSVVSAQPQLHQLSQQHANKLTQRINEKRSLHGACAIKHVNGMSTGVVTGGACRQGLSGAGAEAFFLNYYSGSDEWAAREPVDEWYALGTSDKQLSALLWTGATSFSCEYCTDGDSVGHMSYLSCMFAGVPKDDATLNAQRATKVLPVNSPPCNICLTVTCPAAAACKVQLPCNPSTGCSAQVNMATGSVCDDRDPSTYNDKCNRHGICIGNKPCDRVQCPATSQCNSAGSCVVNVVNGVGTAKCNNPLKPTGTSCNDGNHITINDICIAGGVCQGTDMCAGVTCTALSQCNTIGVCNQGTGLCSNPTKPSGVVCDDGDATTYNDICNSQATCAGNRPCVNFACPAPSQCHMLGSCVVKLQNGVYVPSCVNMPKTMGAACDDGNPMTASDQCDGNGNCNGINNCVGVVCQAASQCHGIGQCNPLTGVCSTVFQPSGMSCFDGNPQTVSDICDGQGTCAGTDNCVGVVCTAMDTCHTVGVCDVQTGICTNPVVTTMIPCDDNDPSTKDDVCNRAAPGVCSGIALCSSITCSVTSPCVASRVCNPQTGLCEDSLYQPANTVCDDGDVTTVNDVCSGTSDTCVGVNLCLNVDCSVQASQQCIATGTCDFQTGNCQFPSKPSNSPCDDGDDLTGNDICMNGICKGSDLCLGVHCPSQPNSCVKSECDPQRGICVVVKLPDGSPCDDNNPLTGSDICTHGFCSGSTDCELIVTGDYGKTPCELHKNFGYASNGKIFADQGCRGKFEHKSSGEVIRCSSSQFGYTECGVNQLRPECAKLSLIPCKSSSGCSGYQKLGSGRCLDRNKNEYRHSRADSITTINECLRIARGASGGDIVGVQYNNSTKRCFVLIPKGSLPILRNSAPWDSHDKSGTGEGSVQNVDYYFDIECWIPENRCTGVTCTAADKCHVKGFCNPKKGLCSHPPAADGTWCTDHQKNPMQIRDTCQRGVCSPSPGGCWVASKWFPSTECKNDRSACNWGSGVYTTKAECCKPGNAHQNGCHTPPTKPTQCWRASKWWPTKECFNDKNACQWSSWNKPGGVFASQADCCKPGAAHKSGCSSYTPPPPVKYDPTLSTTPSQCQCQLNNNCTNTDPVCKSNVDPTFKDYCGCTKINRVSKVRYCVSQDGKNICNKPNVWGECPTGTTICSAYPSYSLKIKKKKSTSAKSLSKTFGRCSGGSSIIRLLAICPVSACPRVSGRRMCPKSVNALLKWGCTVIGVLTTRRRDHSISVLEDTSDDEEEQIAIFDMEDQQNSKLFETVDLGLTGTDSDITTAAAGDTDLENEMRNLKSMLTDEQISETPKPEEFEEEKTDSDSSEASTPLIIGSIISILLLGSGCFIYKKSKSQVKWGNVADRQNNLCSDFPSDSVTAHHTESAPSELISYQQTDDNDILL